MAFVRVKTIKGHHYAYLVENVWHVRGSRQKVKAYLGKVFSPAKAHAVQLPELSSFSFPDAVRALAVWTLFQHGFTQTGTHLSNENITVDSATGTVARQNKRAVLQLNEGFLCQYTVQQLLEFVGE